MSNLPPGVTVSMIPGNRPEDEWLDTFWENINVPTDLMQAEPEALARHVNLFLDMLATAHVKGWKEGREEERMERRESERVFAEAEAQCDSISSDENGPRVQCNRVKGHRGDHRSVGPFGERWWAS